MLKKGFKATKCKTSCRLAISRLRLLRNTKEARMKQMKKDLAQLLEKGLESTARIRVEHIIREQNLLTAYEFLEVFCELIVARLAIIESQKECPIDLKEAISTVIFAAPRCADLPELHDLRRMFGSKYGKEFVASAAELRMDCGVNRNVIEKLSVRAPSAEVKLNVMKAIAEEYQIHWNPSDSEKELTKTPEDLLDGSAQFTGAREMAALHKETEAEGRFAKQHESGSPENSVMSETVNAFDDRVPPHEPVDTVTSEKAPSCNSAVGSTTGETTAVSQSTSSSHTRVSVNQMQHGKSNDFVIPSTVDRKDGPSVVPTPESIYAVAEGSKSSAKASHSSSFNEIHWMQFKDAASAAADAAHKASIAAKAAAELCRDKLQTEGCVKSTIEARSPQETEDAGDSVMKKPQFNEPISNIETSSAQLGYEQNSRKNLASQPEKQPQHDYVPMPFVSNKHGLMEEGSAAASASSPMFDVSGDEEEDIAEVLNGSDKFSHMPDSSPSGWTKESIQNDRKQHSQHPSRWDDIKTNSKSNSKNSNSIFDVPNQRTIPSSFRSEKQSLQISDNLDATQTESEDDSQLERPSVGSRNITEEHNFNEEISERLDDPKYARQHMRTIHSPLGHDYDDVYHHETKFMAARKQPRKHHDIYEAESESEDEFQYDRKPKGARNRARKHEYDDEFNYEVKAMRARNQPIQHDYEESYLETRNEYNKYHSKEMGTSSRIGKQQNFDRPWSESDDESKYERKHGGIKNRPSKHVYEDYSNYERGPVRARKQAIKYDYEEEEEEDEEEFKYGRTLKGVSNRANIDFLVDSHSAKNFKFRKPLEAEKVPKKSLPGQVGQFDEQYDDDDDDDDAIAIASTGSEKDFGKRSSTNHDHHYHQNPNRFTTASSLSSSHQHQRNPNRYSFVRDSLSDFDSHPDRQLPHQILSNTTVRSQQSQGTDDEKQLKLKPHYVNSVRRTGARFPSNEEQQQQQQKIPFLPIHTSAAPAAVNEDETVNISSSKSPSVGINQNPHKSFAKSQRISESSQTKSKSTTLRWESSYRHDSETETDSESEGVAKSPPSKISPSRILSSDQKVGKGQYHADAHQSLKQSSFSNTASSEPQVAATDTKSLVHDSSSRNVFGNVRDSLNTRPDPQSPGRSDLNRSSTQVKTHESSHTAMHGSNSEEDYSEFENDDDQTPTSEPSNYHVSPSRASPFSNMQKQMPGKATQMAAEKPEIQDTQQSKSATQTSSSEATNTPKKAAAAAAWRVHPKLPDYDDLLAKFSQR